MIKDRLKNAKTYYLLSEDIKKGLQWLENNNLETLEAGRYYIDNDRIYVNIDQYETKDDANYEAHRKYIDIQYIISGVEVIEVADISKFPTKAEYNCEKDVEFFENYEKASKTVREEGEYGIFFPYDIHRPGMSLENDTIIRKIVVKVKV